MPVDDKAKDIRWQQRFSNYQKALAQLRRFISKDTFNELEEQGLIQCFEYTHELAWSTLKDFLEYRGHMAIFGSKDATREAFKLSLITDGDVWMEMIQDRNRSVHTYNPDTAKSVASNIKLRFFPMFEALENTLQRLKDES